MPSQAICTAKVVYVGVVLIVSLVSHILLLD